MSNTDTIGRGPDGGPGAGVHPVDEVLPAGQLTVLGLQHVLVMYAGAVAVPLIIGGALDLPKDQIALLINSDLLCAGIVTSSESARRFCVAEMTRALLFAPQAYA